MEKFSVRKPFTVLVAVIIVLLLGAVSYMNMTTDLLPSMSLPYLMVITTYPGASPERIESTVSEPMESALGTVSSVENVYSVNSENYSLVELEFEDGTDMDSAMVKVSSAVQQVASSLPDACGTPSIMEISMDMMATEYVAVSRDDYDIYELSDYVDNDLIPYIERQSGVARVSGIGLVEKSIQVDLNKKKIDRLNDRILGKTVDGLDEMGDALDDANAQVEEGQKALEEQENKFGDQMAESLSSSVKESLSSYTDEAKEKLIQLLVDIQDVQSDVEAISDTMKKNGRALDTGLWEIEMGVHQLTGDVNTIMDAYEKIRSPLSDILTSLRDASSSLDMTTLRKLLDSLSTTSDDLQNIIKQLENAHTDVSSDIDLSDIDLSAFSDTDYSSQISEIERLLDMTEQLQSMDPEDVQAAADYLINSGIASIPGAEDIDWSGMGSIADMVQSLSEVEKELVDKLIADLQQDTKLLNSFSKNVSSTVSSLASSDINSDLSSIAGSLNSVVNEVSGDSIRTIMVGTDRIAGLYSSTKSAMDRLEKIIDEKLPDDVKQDKDTHELIEELKYYIAKVYQDVDDVPEMVDELGNMIGQMAQGELTASVAYSSAAQQLATAENQLSQVQSQYDTMRDSAMENANLDELLNVNTLSQLIYAQNFSMPAGYIDDEDDNSWLLKIGDQYDTAEDISTALLADVDGIGMIRLEDVADVTVIDNSRDTYTNLDGKRAVALAIYKSSTAGTNEVSTAVNSAFDSVMAEKPDVHVVSLMDQGSYITMIVKELLTSMILGAGLAILILALFLRDIRPTLMVGISIPLSVLFTVVLMYFTGLSLNIMTLSGISLGVGMLVDNSIVVMENIIRLRARGLSAARAAVQGAKQVSGSIIASTLTTICVFLPMVFTTGTVRELLLPMALSIGYCLAASLIVAMTVIPASASVILKKNFRSGGTLFDHFTAGYGRILDWCLSHKAVPLLTAVALLAFCVWRLIVMGIVILPDMTGDSIELSIETVYADDPDRAMSIANDAVIRARSLDGVKDVGLMDTSSTTSLISSAAGSQKQDGTFTGYVLLDDDMDAKKTAELVRELNNVMGDLDAEVTVSSSAMGELTSYLSSGLTVDVYGSDMDTLQNIADDVADIIEDTEGFTDVSAGEEEGEQALHLVIDKDKAMSCGLTVAQIYAEIAARLSTDVTSTSITVDGYDYDVVISDKTDTLTRETLMDMEFESQSASQDASSLMDASSLESMFSAFTEDEDSEEASDTGDIDSSETPSSEDDSEDEETSTVHKLSEFAHLEESTSPATINRQNQTRYIAVSATTEDGYNTTVQSRVLEEKLDEYRSSLPSGYSIVVGGETEQVTKMIKQMAGLLALALVFIYLVMVAQFQSLLSPFIILFTVPLAFTGGMIGLLLAGEQLSMLSLMGFLVLMGTVVNNGIVFVDYTNQLRIGGMRRRAALIAAGRTRMRPILMTALTTILAMSQMIFGSGMATQLSRGMAIVIACGLLYATFMTLFIVPIMYDILFKKKPLNVQVDDSIDDVPDDAAEFIENQRNYR